MLKCLLGLFVALSLNASTHIVILGDPHIPGKHLEAKEHVLEQINQWSDVDSVVATGDLCSLTGTHEEYTQVKDYFSKLRKPLYVITGNHDFIYADELGEDGKFLHGTPKMQNEKLQRFQKAFHLPKLYYSVQKESYLLIFLSADTPEHLAQLSTEQLNWFENELKTHPKMPTIVFFHAPLDHTLERYNRWANTPNFVAQPKEAIHRLIVQNPQLFLWISGHTHTSAKEPSFASSINRYEQVTNVHNSDMNKETIWSNSLFLEKDRVRIQTYDHQAHQWLPSLERTILVPKF